MANTSSELANFSLRGLPIDRLRELGRDFLNHDADVIATLEKTQLVSELSAAASESTGLSRALRKQSISVKPSFYLLRISRGEQIPMPDARKRIRRYLMRSNIGLQNLQVQAIEEYEPGAVQVLLTWEADLTYWTPDITLAHVKELKFGFGIIDFRARKSLIACHTLKERDEVSELLCEGFSIELMNLVLTKPLLEQIGTFDKVKRASYVIEKPDNTTPTNIVYADDSLGAKKLAIEEENNSRSQRSQSFYRIPILNGVLEEGLGATSESGKLWIPKETPVDVVRDYGTALLGRITGTIDNMIQDDRIEEVLSTYRFDEISGISSADPLLLRQALAELIRTVIVMLATEEEERPYSVSTELVVSGVPYFFTYPFLRLRDDETGEVALWTDGQYSSKSVRITGRAEDLQVSSFPGKDLIDIQNVVHPITGNTIQIDNVLSSLQLIPSEHLLKITADALNRVSESISKLRDVKAIFFWIYGNVIKVDVRRAFGSTRPATIIQAQEFTELEGVFRKQNVPATRRKDVNARLVRLGEKCTSISDENCETCLLDKKWICLRSLVGRYLKAPKILAHKGIELCDLSGRGHINGKEHRIWGFAKLPSGKNDKGLTLRNKPGAVLMAQICGQLDKPTFDTVLVLTPATVNQDFEERLEVLCKAFGKHLCFVSLDELGRMLLDFEEQAAFDQVSVDELYAESRKKQGKPKLLTASA